MPGTLARERARLNDACHSGEMATLLNLLINLKDTFFDTAVGPRQIWHACADRDETDSHQKKLTQTTAGGVYGVIY